MSKEWFKRSFRRALVDMHIPDWDVRFLSQFDPQRYVEALKRMRVASIMHYANSHVGLCYYPTKVGAMHKGLKGRDMFGEVIELCKKEGIAVVAYYSVIFNNWAYIEHPEWRMLPWGARQRGRYGVCCPNSPYREFALEQTREIVENYDIDGIFFDMTFWPAVCYCHHCARRYKEETGEEMPRMIDWCSPRWVKFQRTRERWIREFAEELSGLVRRLKPDVTATHQFSTILHDWKLAVPLELADQCDYVCGDFYGETIQQSVVCKAFMDITKSRPFEFHTSISPNLTDHVSVKHPQRLEAQIALAPAHSSAIQLIHAIDPEGSLNEDVCQYAGEILSKIEPYEGFLGGELCADVGIYFSLESRFDPADNGKSAEDVGSLSGYVPHLEALMGAARYLQRAHIPFGIVTRRGLKELDKYQVIVLPDVLVLTEEEVEAFRKFVEKGGGLYASGRCGLTDSEGNPYPDFPLEDVLGVSRVGEVPYRLSFFTPSLEEFASWIYPQHHLIHNLHTTTVANRSGRILATLTLPYYPPHIGDILTPSFSSIHSNPPGPKGEEPAIVVNEFGKGKVVYSVGALEGVDHHINQRVFIELIRFLLRRPLWFEGEGHPAVEMVLLHQPENKRFLLSLINSQREFPNAPVNFAFRVRLPQGRKFKKLYLLPTLQEVEFVLREGNVVEGRTDSLEVLSIYLLEYE